MLAFVTVLAPVLLLFIALYHECVRPERSYYAVAYGGCLVALGPVLYLLACWYRATSSEL